MIKSFNERVNSLPEDRQLTIQNRANQLIAEEMTLRDLRLALQKTQQDLSQSLHIKQDGISRLEKRSDMLFSTLSKYIASMGGSLKITAEFPNRPSVIIHGLGDIKVS